VSVPTSQQSGTRSTHWDRAALTQSEMLAQVAVVARLPWPKPAFPLVNDSWASVATADLSRSCHKKSAISILITATKLTIRTNNTRRPRRAPRASTAVFTVRSSFSYMQTPWIPRGTQCARTRKRAGGELVRWGRRSGVGEFTKAATATPFSGASMPNEPSRTDHRIEINEGSLKKNLNAPPTKQQPPPPRPQTAPPPPRHPTKPGQ
jgi:hypothetical protein